MLQHFKLENLDTALLMVEKDYVKSTIDLQDAYFAVNIRQEFRKFRWRGKLFRFRGVPMGLACTPYVFTKLLKLIFAVLGDGKNNVFYLDDMGEMQSYNGAD